MKKVILIFSFLLISATTLLACTNFIVTKGASKDGSVMIVYTCDGEFHPHLRITPAADHEPGEMIKLRNWRTGVSGEIPQVPYTYAIVGPHMNEHQVSIGETTFGGREELQDTTKFLHYWQMMHLTLQRAKTAREAVEVLTGLADKYGYGSSGESFSIGDPDEAWIVEMIGTGSDRDGAVWVAVKVPDGYVSGHANKSRIGEFPMDDPENCLYSDNVKSFAIEKGYYDPDSGEPFRFNEVYDPSTPSNLRYCETRVWSMFNRANPGLNLSPDYHRGVKGAERYPLWIKPAEKMRVSDVMDIIRDHYEGTAYDMTDGLAAGPFGNPNRCRPLTFEVNGKQATWERPISTTKTGFSFIAQSRSNLPDPIGGILWYGMDDTYTTCYIPLYAGIDSVPKPFGTGNIREFSWESAWWVFNFVANFANVRYNLMVKDIQKVQHKLETRFIAETDSIDKAAMKLYKEDREKLKEFLTEYSVSRGNQAYRRWKKLGEELICKYNDGYVKNEKGRPETRGYSKDWYKKAVEDEPYHYLPVWDEDSAKAKEPTMF
jgi:dipeptidase